MKPFSGSLEVAHVVLGSIALGLGFLQILAILGRPAPVRCLLSPCQSLLQGCTVEQQMAGLGCRAS